MNEARNGRRVMMISASLLFLPFVCCFSTILATQDRIPSQLALRVLCTVVQFGSVVVSLLVPLALIAFQQRSWKTNLGSAFKFAILWLAVQSVALFALAFLSVALFGDGSGGTP